MQLEQIRAGVPVRTGPLGDTVGMLIHARHLAVRRAGVTGTVTGWVPGHGGDVWWVQHDHDDTVGAYVFTELRPWLEDE